MNQDIVKLKFRYNKGKLYWRKHKGVPTAVRGRLAGSLDDKGYMRIKVDGKKYRRHRLVYLLHHGSVPRYVDHIDGSPANDNVSNLRGCDHTQNMQNCRTRTDSKTGIRNVYHNKAAGTYSVIITANKIAYYLGTFKDKLAAKAIAEAARSVYHGEFARLA